MFLWSVAALCQSTPMCKDPLCFLCMLMISTSLLTLCLRQLTTCECTGKSVRVSELKSSPGSSCSGWPWLFSLLPQAEQLGSGALRDDNLLSVRKPAVGRTHSLPNDSYMFLSPQPVGQTSPTAAHPQGPQHILGTHRAQSGNATFLFNVI